MPAEAALNPYTDCVVVRFSNFPPALPPPGVPVSEQAPSPAASERVKVDAKAKNNFFIIAFSLSLLLIYPGISGFIPVTPI